MSFEQDFSDEQKLYLQGFASGFAARRTGQGPGAAGEGVPAGPERIHREAQDRTIAAGGKLTPEEQAKRAKNPLDGWDEFTARAAKGEFPKGTDVFLTKYHGMFYVAPAQNAYMCRLRIPGGILNSFQMRGIADLAAQHGGGYADITTRANLQIREIGPQSPVAVVTGLQELGLTSRGSGADNIRNITGSPTAGIDPQELIDTRPLCRELQHYILNHREMYGLPRKFNIAFDGGGRIAALEDTNDIGFSAVRVAAGQAVPEGVYFRLALGGITGHLDFARDTGLLLRPEECVPVAAAMVRVFIAHGDRTDRKKARLKYLLDKWGFEKFLEETEKLLPVPLTRFPLAQCEPRPPVDRQGHVGVQAQKQAGQHYIGVVVPVGRLTVTQMHGLADLAAQHGSGTLRLTVWQNLLLSDIPAEKIEAVQQGLLALGLDWRADAVRAGLVACTGNTGCKFAAANTKGQAQIIAAFLDGKVAMDSPVNIHLTGCHHSCAQHYIGDIGLIATKVPQGEDEVEGYHIHVGGGANAERAIAREIWKAVPFAAVPPRIEALLKGYQAQRRDAAESFHVFANRHSPEELRRLAGFPDAEG